jgi:hypothetical protein
MDMLDLLKRMVGNNSTIRLVDTGICRIRLFRETSLNQGRAVRIARLLPIKVRLYWNGAVGEPIVQITMRDNSNRVSRLCSKAVTRLSNKRA